MQEYRAPLLQQIDISTQLVSFPQETRRLQNPRASERMPPARLILSLGDYVALGVTFQNPAARATVW